MLKHVISLRAIENLFLFDKYFFMNFIIKLKETWETWNQKTWAYKLGQYNSEMQIPGIILFGIKTVLFWIVQI